MNKKTSLRASMSNSCSLLILEMVRILSSEKRNGHYSELRVSRPRSLLSTKSRFRGRQLTFGAPSNPENGPQISIAVWGQREMAGKWPLSRLIFIRKRGGCSVFHFGNLNYLFEPSNSGDWVVESFFSRGQGTMSSFSPFRNCDANHFHIQLPNFETCSRSALILVVFFLWRTFSLTSSWSNRRSILEIITISEVSLANCRIRDQIPNETRDMPESPALSRFPISPPFYSLEMTLHNRLPQKSALKVPASYLSPPEKVDFDGYLLSSPREAFKRW